MIGEIRGEIMESASGVDISGTKRFKSLPSVIDTIEDRAKEILDLLDGVGIDNLSDITKARDKCKELADALY